MLAKHLALAGVLAFATVTPTNGLGLDSLFGNVDELLEGIGGISDDNGDDEGPPPPPKAADKIVCWTPRYLDAGLYFKVAAEAGTCSAIVAELNTVMINDIGGVAASQTGSVPFAYTEQVAHIMELVQSNRVKFALLPSKDFDEGKVKAALTKHGGIVEEAFNALLDACQSCSRATFAEMTMSPGMSALDHPSPSYFERGLKCSEDDGNLYTSTETQCLEVAGVLNTFDGIAGVDCTDGGAPGRFYGWHLYIISRKMGECKKVAAKMNEMLTPEAMCNRVGTYQTDGTCDCTDPTAVGPTCEFSNAKTCSDAGIAQANGSCVCNGPATGLGLTCSEISNAKTCSDAGVVQVNYQVFTVNSECEEKGMMTCCNGDTSIYLGDDGDDERGDCVSAEHLNDGDNDCRDGSDESTPPFSACRIGDMRYNSSCVCNGPATGIGRTCSELSNAMNCSNNGVVDAAGQCTCTNAAGPSCEYSNAKTCSNAGIAQPDGSCVCNDAAVAQAGGSCAKASASINATSIIGPVLGGISALIGVIVLMVRVRHADNKWDEILIVCRCKDREAEDGMNTTVTVFEAPAGDSVINIEPKKTNQSAHVKHNPMFDATAAGNADDATGRKKLLAKYRKRMSMYYKNDGTLDDEEAEALQDEFEGKGITMDEHQSMLKEIKAEYKTATATKPDMDVEPSSAAAPKAKKKKKTPKSVGANSVGKRCTVNGYDCEGTIRFVGPHHETGKDRVGVELDEAVGKHSGTVNGNEYFSCGKKCGVLVDAKKVSEC